MAQFYESEYTRFINHYLTDHPGVAAEQATHWALDWRPVSVELKPSAVKRGSEAAEDCLAWYPGRLEQLATPSDGFHPQDRA